ncbi:Gfo/Idh/MocA family oxidoreductase [Bacillus salipaludis]|uniref:Gfo/Idh/MocA family oxidoreductase n=1 Tax=Bacillus salipaludis TaxID=2547811 RepID=UPI003D1B5CC5
MNLIKVGVVGAGKMGSYHCLKLNQMKNVNFVGVYDTDTRKAVEITKKLSGIAFDSYQDLLKSVDAVIIAAPTKYHFVLVEEAIKNDKHILVEKPLTVSLEEADKIKSLLKNQNLIFQVGHIERFNPVIQRLANYLNKEKIISIEAKRLGYSDRLLDADVVLDVMIHDIDIILSLVKSPITRISAEGVLSNGRYDTVTALLLFENGVMATLIASNVSHEKTRTLSVFEKDQVIKTDYLTKQQYILTNNVINQNPRYPATTETVIAKMVTSPQDPLLDELQHFFDCIYSNQQPLIGVEDGANAVEVALKIKKCLP